MIANTQILQYSEQYFFLSVPHESFMSTILFLIAKNIGFLANTFKIIVPSIIQINFNRDARI